jgi:hypothetical protein
VGRAQARPDELQLGVELPRLDAGLHAADDLEPVLVARLLLAVLRRKAERHVEREVLVELEAARRDTDDAVALVVDGDVLADDLGVAAEAVLPERVGEDDDVVLARRLLLGGEPAAEVRANAEELEEAGRDGADRHALGGPGAGQVAGRRRVDGRRLEPLAHLLHVEVLEHREHLVRVGVLLVDAAEIDEPLGLAVRQRAEEDAADDAEDRGVRADPDRERQHHDGEEAGGAEDATEEAFHARSPSQPRAGRNEYDFEELPRSRRS